MTPVCKYCLNLTILILTITNLQTVSSLDCISSGIDTSEPEVFIFKISNGMNVTELNGTLATFGLGDPVEFRLECTSDRPVKWIFDEDFSDRGIKNTGNTLTSRTIGNFTDEKTYKFLAPYSLQINSPEIQEPLVLVCQNIGHSCERRIVLGSFDEQGLKYRVKLLTKQEETVKHVIDFERELARSSNTSAIRPSCPFNLTLRYDQSYYALIFFWTPSGPIAEFRLESAQSLENAYRFTSILDERCIDFGFDITPLGKCPQCTQLDFNVHHFKPAVFYNAVGNDRRILKGFFDLKTSTPSFFYSWEYVDPQDMMLMSAPIEAFKGQEVQVTCSTSLYLFSDGTQVGWSIEGDISPREFVSADVLYEQTTISNYGYINTTVGVRPSKTFLDENRIDNVTISCIAPIWNSTAWVTKSEIVRLIDSTSPIVLHKLEPSLNEVVVGQNFSFKCEAEGFPTPSLKIIPPQQNLNYTEREITEGNYTVLVVTFSKIEATYEGKYNCVATSLVSEDYKVFEIKIPAEFPQFLKIIIIGAGALTLIFLFVAAALTFKLRKEKEEFIRLTEEAILRFQEGYKNTTGIGFDSSAEYKDYEIPFARWGMTGTMLGSGAFGVVQKGFIEQGREKTVLAVKTVNSPKDVTDFENSLMELTIMAYMGQNEHIVSLIACNVENIHKRSIYIGVEYCANGDLLSYVQKRRALFHSFVKDGEITLDWISSSGSYANIINTANFSTVDLYKWSYQISNGMEFLESKKVLHADLAARNVLLTQDKIAKISDFGLSRKLLDSSNYTKKTNSPLPWRWMAIESLKFQQFSTSSDVWSYGVTLYEIFSLGAEPWPDQGWTVEFVSELEHGRRLSRPNFATENMYNAIMLECWRNEPEDRVTFETAREFFENAITAFNSIEGNPNECLSIC